MGKMLSSAEAAKRLRVSVRRIQQLAERLGGVRVGRDYVFDSEIVAKFRPEKPGRPRKSA